MEVIILAGGLGTRLRSAIGNEIPKCMAPVAGRPFLWHLLSYLTRFDVSRVVLSVGHLREVIFDWIEQVKDEFPFEFDYAVEETPLGTGGGIKLAMTHVKGDDAIVLNGDTFFDVSLDDFLALHKSKSAAISLALKPMQKFERYGTVTKDANGVITAFKEKQYCESGDINGGVYCINKQRIEWPTEDKFSMEKDVFEPSVSKKNMYAFDFGGYFIDIGIPEDYAKANKDFA